MNILLIGFMGCGKSTLGKKLAKKMEKTFIDLDKIIEQEEGMIVSQIFESKGEDYFRLAESNWLNSFKEDGFVIALGGGAACSYQNIKRINEIGTSIYLEISVGGLTNRLINSKQKRPLIELYKDDKDRLLLEIEKLLKKREIFYKQANIIFEATNVSSTKLDYLIEMIDYLK